jgi:hypothetical protein
MTSYVPDCFFGDAPFSELRVQWRNRLSSPGAHGPSALLQRSGHIREDRQHCGNRSEQLHTKLLGGRHKFTVTGTAAAGGRELKYGLGADRLLVTNHKAHSLML